MANEIIQSAALSENIAAMEKCIDAMLVEQRKAAHNAIDMDDWDKAEEILASSKKNIVRIESLKNKLAEFKAEAVKLEFLTDDKSAEKPSEPKAEQPKPEPKPTEQPKPESKPAEQSKPEPKPAEQPKPAPKPAEQPKPAPKPVEQPKPAPKPAEQPKPAPKPAEQPKPVSKPAAHTAVNVDILDMDMSDIEDDEGAKDPIIDACEELITKFPFSMRLIYSNQKIGKFFTADEVIATNDMSKPQQLSNGLWVETNIPEEKIQAFIRGVTRYCEESVNM